MRLRSRLERLEASPHLEVKNIHVNRRCPECDESKRDDMREVSRQRLATGGELVTFECRCLGAYET